MFEGPISKGSVAFQDTHAQYGHKPIEQHVHDVLVIGLLKQARLRLVA